MTTRMPRARTPILLSLALTGALLGGCDTVSGWFGKSPKPPLPGERVAVLAGERKVQADPQLAGAPVALPPAVTNDAWAQAGGVPEHDPGHLALSASPTEAFRASVGSGSSSSQVLLGAPVIGGGRIYVMDAASQVSALDPRNGGSYWRVDARAEKDRGDAMGGGVAFAEGKVFAATGYGEVLALDPANGGVIWRKKVVGPVRAAPTVVNGRVFVVTIDNQLVALSANDGNQLWTHSGILETAGLLGAASPAATNTLVVAAYSSGELFGLRPENGRVAWQENLAAIRRMGSLAGLADIRGMPVVDRGLVIAVSHSGRMIAIDERIGARVWEVEVGGVQTPYVAGDTIFVATNDAEVIAVTRQGGRVRWVTGLERHKDAQRRQGPISWAGPVVAGGRVWVTGSHGVLVALDPQSGREQARYPLPGPTYLPPVVANNTLYVLTDSGTLVAFR